MSDTRIQHLPEVTYATPQLASKHEQLVRASEHLWRVQDAGGRILGHLRVVADPHGLRYRAERLHLATRAFRIVGEFWCPDDAVQALRHG